MKPEMSMANCKFALDTITKCLLRKRLVNRSF
jgi:hypothetical protein